MSLPVLQVLKHGDKQHDKKRHESQQTAWAWRRIWCHGWKSVVPMVASRNTLTFTSNIGKIRWKGNLQLSGIDFLLLGGSPTEAHFEIQDQLYLGYLVTCGDHCPWNFPQSFSFGLLCRFYRVSRLGKWNDDEGGLTKHPDQKVQCPRTEGKFKERQHVFAEGFWISTKVFGVTVSWTFLVGQWPMNTWKAGDSGEIWKGLAWPQTVPMCSMYCIENIPTFTFPIKAN